MNKDIIGVETTFFEVFQRYDRQLKDMNWLIALGKSQRITFRFTGFLHLIFDNP